MSNVDNGISLKEKNNLDLSGLLKSAFENNYYTTSKYYDFSKSIIPSYNLKLKYINEFKQFNIIGNKNISINNYSQSELDLMDSKNINYLSVIPIDNYSKESDLDKSSYIEYPIWFYKPYDKAFSLCDKSFRNLSRRAEKNNFIVKKVNTLNSMALDQIYSLYVNQMKRLNGFILPKLYFEEYSKLDDSIFFLIYDALDSTKLISYSMCVEYLGNLYHSIGGSDGEYFSKLINYKLYNELLKYACENKLNIHMGLGTHNSGYNLFKKKIGAICFKCIQKPDLGKFSKFEKIYNSKIVGNVFFLYSKLNSGKIAYTLMPFT